MQVTPLGLDHIYYPLYPLSRASPFPMIHAGSNTPFGILVPQPPIILVL